MREKFLVHYQLAGRYLLIRISGIMQSINLRLPGTVTMYFGTIPPITYP